MYFLIRLILAFIPVKRWRKRLRNPVQNLVFGAPVRRTAAKIGMAPHFHGPCVVTKTTYIGDFVSMGGVEAHGGGKFVIGNHVHFGPEVLVLTQNHEHHGDALPYSHTFVLKDVVVDDCAWIGARVTLLPGTHIGEGAIIQAGSVVHGEIPSCAIAGGNPAKPFAWRDRAHYERLQSEGRFYR